MPEKILDKCLGFPRAKELTGVSEPTIRRWVKAGMFPKPIPLGPNRVGFLQSEIEQWLAARIEARARAEGQVKRTQQAQKAIACRHEQRGVAARTRKGA